MSSQRIPQTITPEFIHGVCVALREGAGVRHRLPFDGLLDIERKLPFLCVYRDPVGKEDSATRRLVAGGASYLITSARSDQRKRSVTLFDAIVATLAAEFGAFLLVEIWADAEVEEDETVDPEATRPAFTIHAGEQEDEGMARVHETLEEGLGRIKVMKKSADVTMNYASEISPPGMAPLLTPARMRELNCRSIGLAVQPIYRSPDRGDAFPMILRTLHRGITRALKRACFTFTQLETTHRPSHYHSLGPRAVSRSMWTVDRKLAEIAGEFDFLLQVTPINTNAAWKSFEIGGFENPPVFHYRPLPIDPPILKRQLYSINLEGVEDPTLDRLFREKRAELDRQLTMLLERNTGKFLYGSLQLYGPVDEGLKHAATDILHQFADRSGDGQAGGTVTAKEFADRARSVIERFQKALPEMKATVKVTDEVVGLMVSKGHLMINGEMRVSESRAQALIEHEVGTHVLTYWNAHAQPLKLLASGLPGYDELQEGLAVLFEYLVGGLSRARLRTLAARVIAARSVQDGASFIETFKVLKNDYYFEPSSAFRITTRVYRSGGLTKDAVYLRGLMGVLDFVKDGGDLKSLFIGKIARRHLPIIQELRHRQVLSAPPALPFCLEEGCQSRLAAIRDGLTPSQLARS